jgi:hypothetical protein
MTGWEDFHYKKLGRVADGFHLGLGVSAPTDRKFLCSPGQKQERMLCNGLAAIGHRPSAIGHRPSAIGHRPSAIGHRPSAIRHPPSAIRHPPSAIRHPPSAIRHCPPSAPSCGGSQTTGPRLPFAFQFPLSNFRSPARLPHGFGRWAFVGIAEPWEAGHTAREFITKSKSRLPRHPI